ncbi:hypothetical protein IG631_23975 [Alternaria alternata]|nr:hypothetical protein IG631_23975 [Alternaria alternata]
MRQPVFIIASITALCDCDCDCGNDVALSKYCMNIMIALPIVNFKCCGLVECGVFSTSLVAYDPYSASSRRWHFREDGSRSYISVAICLLCDLFRFPWDAKDA